MPLTPELYNQLKEDQYKYLVYKRIPERKDIGVYEPVKELPNYFVISYNSIEDERIKTSVFGNKTENMLLVYNW